MVPGAPGALDHGSQGPIKQKVENISKMIYDNIMWDYDTSILLDDNMILLNDDTMIL